MRKRIRRFPGRIQSKPWRYLEFFEENKYRVRKKGTIECPFWHRKVGRRRTVKQEEEKNQIKGKSTKTQYIAEVRTR